MKEQRTHLPGFVRWARRLAGAWRGRPQRQLRLCETLGLGERRFLAVVQFEEQKFLIGGAGNSVVLLTTLRRNNAAQLFSGGMPESGPNEFEQP